MDPGHLEAQTILDPVPPPRRAGLGMLGSFTNTPITRSDPAVPQSFNLDHFFAKVVDQLTVGEEPNQTIIAPAILDGYVVCYRNGIIVKILQAEIDDVNYAYLRIDFANNDEYPVCDGIQATQADSGETFHLETGANGTKLYVALAMNWHPDC